jgi:hypothetical protein
VSAIFNLFVAMDSFKKDNVHQKDFFLGEFGFFSSRKPFTHLVCSEYLIEVFGDAIMPLCSFPSKRRLIKTFHWT